MSKFERGIMYRDAMDALNDLNDAADPGQCLTSESVLGSYVSHDAIRRYAASAAAKLKAVLELKNIDDGGYLADCLEFVRDLAADCDYNTTYKSGVLINALGHLHDLEAATEPAIVENCPPFVWARTAEGDCICGYFVTAAAVLPIVKVDDEGVVYSLRSAAAPHLRISAGRLSVEAVTADILRHWRLLAVLGNETDPDWQRRIHYVEDAAIEYFYHGEAEICATVDEIKSIMEELKNGDRD